MMMTTNREIIAIIDNVIRIKRDSLGPDLLSRIRDSLTRENPAYHLMRGMANSNNPRFRYIKLPPATVSSFEDDGKTVYIPRGFKCELIEIAHNFGVKIIFYDETISFDRNPLIRMKDEVQLTLYQKKAVGQLSMSKEGILTAPCGGGKTVTGIAVITSLKQPTLVVVHTTDLIEQWKREIVDKCNLPFLPGQFGGGEHVISDITVATVQTLIRMKMNDLRSFLDRFGCIILDEAHHCPADTFISILNLSKSKFRFGLTATPKRKDGLEFLMTDTIGPIVSEISDADLQLAGRSQSCVVRELHTSFYTRYTAAEWAKLLSEMVNDHDRNLLIIRQILKTWNDGHFPLVLSDRVGHCKFIESELRRHGMNVQTLIGEIPKIKRSQIISDAKGGLVDAIVATKVADEGLDIPNLSCIHLVTPTADQSKLQQRIGRIRRPIEGKVALVVDYIDARVANCIRMYRQRKSLYKRWGFTNE